jgi:3-oxoadipate enol-lactonase
MPFAALGPVKLAYEIAGSGPPLLMIMGLASTRHHWYGFEHALASTATTITFDNRGGGESTGPIAVSLTELADDALHLLDHLRIERADVLGASMGGMIAQRLALTHPDRVGRLVLGCTHHGGVSQIWPSRTVLAKVAGRGGSPAELTRAFLSVCFSRDYIARDPEGYEAMVAHGAAHPFPHPVLVSQLGAIMGHDTAARLSRLELPTLVIAGEDDELIPSGNSRLLAQLLPNAELLLLPGVGHVFWREAPERARAAIANFLLTGASLDAAAVRRHIRASE